jgi:hypothetical protein
LSPVTAIDSSLTETIFSTCNFFSTLSSLSPFLDSSSDSEPSFIHES